MERTVRCVLASTLLAVAAVLPGASAQAKARTLELPGLREPVKVLTDRLGVPHVDAKSDHDFLFAEGYVHARDRFFQMDANRRAASGTLAELTGNPGDPTQEAQARILGRLPTIVAAFSTPLVFVDAAAARIDAAAFAARTGGALGRSAPASMQSTLAGAERWIGDHVRWRGPRCGGRVAVEGLLGPLQDNGGPTPSDALLPGSPAIDAISPADCTWDVDDMPSPVR